MMEELGSRWGEARGGIDGAQDELTTLAEYVVEAVQTGERMAGAGFQVHIVVLEFGRGGFRFDRHFEADDLSGFVDGMETHVELLRRDHDMFCETRRKEREAG